MSRNCFPITLVEKHDENTNVQKARRVPGTILETGTFTLGGDISKCEVSKAPKKKGGINKTVDFLMDGLEYLQQYKGMPAVHCALKEAKKQSSAKIAWMGQHDVVADVLPDEDETIVRLDAEWLEIFKANELAEAAEGLPVLAAALNLYILGAIGGATQREAIHLIRDFLVQLPASDVDSLHAALQSRVIDHNNSFSLMLTLSQDNELAFELEQLELNTFMPVRSNVLYETGNQLEHELFKQRREGGKVNLKKCFKSVLDETPIAEEEIDALLDCIKNNDELEQGENLPAVSKLMEENLKWRDRWVTWMIAQMRVDVPYNQSEVVRLLKQPMEDIDEKRALINEAIRTSYDMETEGTNIKRITRWARETDKRMVAGRLSRAFGNQSQLLSVAKNLADKEGLLPSVKKLYEAGMQEPALQTHASRLLHLIQQKKPTPFAQTIGALNAFEEALFDYQTAQFKKMLEEKDEASRRIVGRPSAETCDNVLNAIQKKVQNLYRIAADFRDALEQTQMDPAAFIILLQRLHPAETVNLANANLLRDVHPGKEDDLRDLMRQGGHFTYSSPGMGRVTDEQGNSENSNWILEVDDWIEAIPLFIHERVVKQLVQVGNEEIEIDVIQTEVDQEAMEAFFRMHAEFWAQNIDAVMNSEHVGLARDIMVRRDSELSEQAAAYREENPDKTESEAAYYVTKDRDDLRQGIVSLAALIAKAYRDNIETVNQTVELQGIKRIDAVEKLIVEKTPVKKIIDAPSAEAIAKAAEEKAKGQVAKEAETLVEYTTFPTRRTSSLHILTTESAGMTEGYVQTWIEEEIALYNVIRSEKLEDEVNKRVDNFRTRIQTIGKKVIAEFGMEVVIDEVMAQQRLPEPAAVLTVLTSFKPVIIEAAKLAVMIEYEEQHGKRKVNYTKADDPTAVDDYLKKNRTQLMKVAVPKVAENNGKAFDQKADEFRQQDKKASEYQIQKKVIETEEDYKEELDALVRFEARTAVLEQWAKKNPELKLQEQMENYIRQRTMMAKSTARKQVVAEHKLNAMCMHPVNYYQATGGNKRYNLLYTPSRVNLGERERDSVVKWRQWVGGADASAAQAGFEFYSFINEGGVEERPALAYAEIQKTSENALCVTHFAGSNALALLCMAVLEGDAEDMADQMNLRHDRMIPPAGEGYGGYCVPKDGLFLAFVLSLQNEIKLRQMGIPERYHEGVMAMAKHVLLHQHDFESYFDWQRWAADKLLEYRQLKKFFDFKDDIMVFHMTKIARAVENLGQPWHETTPGDKLVANLAARWGVEHMIIHAEQVNRFMVFYKAWMIYDALRQAREENPHCHTEEEAVVALSAEYKPVQDVRYSTGMRLFEILAQTHEHLTHSLDEEGQNLAQLMFYGFDPDTDDPVGKRAVQEVTNAFRLDMKNKEVVERMKEAFPPHRPIGDIVMTSATMSSTQDLLFYTSDTKLDEIGSQVQVILGDYGLTEDQIRANAIVHGGNLRRWAGIKELPKEEQDDLIRRVGGNIHALVLQMRGPGRDYEVDIQGVDVLNTGIPFKQLIEQLDDMPKVVALMRNGNPNSALAITDGAAGRARRVLTYNDVELFFAACEQIGRKGVYRAVGLGRHIIDRLREDMHKKRTRAEALYDAIAAVADKQDDEAVENAVAVYTDMREAITADEEAVKALREEEKLKRYKKWKPRFFYISQALAKISAGIPLQQLDFGTWLAGIGGMYLVCGEPQNVIDERRETWEEAARVLVDKLGKVETEVKPFTGKDLEALAKSVVRPEYAPDTQQFAQQMLTESSSKAVEIAAREALERRKALKVRAERAKAFNDREDGFREGLAKQFSQFEDCWKQGQKCLNSIWDDTAAVYKLKTETSKRTELRSSINKEFGRFIALTRQGIAALVSEIMPETNAAEKSAKRQILADLQTVYTGREIIFEELKKLAGGYEDIGGIARLAEAADGDREKLDLIAKGIEMFYVTFALAQVLEFALQLPDEVDPAMFWKNLVDFFAESINDHWYEYWPWAYSRGIGFKDVPTEDKYQMAVERHAWLYKFLRALLVERSELAERPKKDVDALLGNFAHGKSIVAIGANGSTDLEIQWRAYNQLREITFVKSDGFPIPEVFHEFNPKIIEADKRVNVGILFPVGRTHVSRALREGPTLNRELQEKDKPGANIIITRYNDFVEVDGAERKALLLTDGHLYLDEKEYAAALKDAGLKKAEANERVKQAKAEGRLNDKGIRVAARFMQKGKPAPVVAGSLIPFHGTPVYTSGQSEEEGMPATIQSQVYTDVTYDKSLYPQIFTEESGVNLPPEIDWINEWNKGLSGEDIIEKIAEGWAEKGYKGLRKFAKDHPIVLIKGAAESGARNLKVFEIQDDHARIVEEELRNAAQFVYDVSRGQNVVIQAAIFTNPELWASPELMESFVDRQVMDWNTPVNRDSYPRSAIYGSMRIVACSSNPKKKYDTAFPISLMSLQVATNVGRGGTLEPLRKDLIQPQFRKRIMDGLREQGPKMMQAMTEFIEKYGPDWEKQTGKAIGEDLRGVSYGWANYLMGDFVITPVFKRRGRLVDIQPIFDDEGRRVGSQPILQDPDGRFEGEIIDWQFIHLEPNVGIGLWDRYNLREDINEQQAAASEGRKFNADNVGRSDRTVISNFVQAGEEYIKANFGKDGIARDAVNQSVK